jgi:hypothetical protein
MASARSNPVGRASNTCSISARRGAADGAADRKHRRLSIGADLGVDIATAGLLVTGYAVGIAVGGPILTFAVRFPGGSPCVQLRLSRGEANA